MRTDSIEEEKAKDFFKDNDFIINDEFRKQKAESFSSGSVSSSFSEIVQATYKKGFFFVFLQFFWVSLTLVMVCDGGGGGFSSPSSLSAFDAESEIEFNIFVHLS